MNNAKNIFAAGITQTRQMTALYDHFINDLHIPHEQVADILRFQIVYAVSGFDRLLHELIRKGVIEILFNRRVKTNKFLSHAFKAETLLKAIEYSDPSYIPASPQETTEYVVNKDMSEKLSFLSFQAPDKVKDGLSIIWNESQKMAIIADDIGIAGATINDRQKTLEQELSLIVQRRNQIAHEGDIDAVTNLKRDITKQQAEDAVNFISNVGLSIHKFVTMPSCYVSPPSP